MSGTEEEEVFLVSQWSLLLAAYRGNGDTVPAGLIASFLASSRLDNATLARIWDLSNPYKKDHFDVHAFCQAARLVAQAQNGRELSLGSRDPKLPLPRFNFTFPSSPGGSPSPPSLVPKSTSPVPGMPHSSYHSPPPLNPTFSPPPQMPAGSTPPNSSSPVSYSSGSPISGGAGNVVLIPVAKTPMPNYQPISMDERVKYTEIFNSQRPVMGLITEEQARGVFLKSNFPLQVIDRIWALSDLNKDGKLDVDEFCIGMRITYDLLTGMLKTIPNELPLELVPKNRQVIPAGSGIQPSLSTTLSNLSSAFSSATIRPSPSPSPSPSPIPSPHPSPPPTYQNPPRRANNLSVPPEKHAPPPATPKVVVVAQNPEEIAALEREIEAETEKIEATKKMIESNKQEIQALEKEVQDYERIGALQVKHNQLIDEDVNQLRAALKESGEILARHKKINDERMQMILEAQELETHTVCNMDLLRQRLSEQGTA